MATVKDTSSLMAGVTSLETAKQPPLPPVGRHNPAIRAELDQVLASPTDYILDDSYKTIAAGRTLFAEEFAGRAAGRPWCNAAGSSARRQPSAKGAGRKTALSIAEEQTLFLRYNYARYRVALIMNRHAGRHLTAKVATELLWWHKQSLAIRDQIIKANLPLVLAMAKRTRLANADYMELISEGNMALLRSVEKFDCTRGFKFSTYACRAILKSFSRVAMRASRYRGRFPTEFDPTLEKSTYQEELRETHEADCVDELRGIISQNSANLNEVEVKVLQARFALGQVAGAPGDGPKTLEQVGLLIGVTKERVRQIQNRALDKLRAKLQDDFLAA